MGIHSASSGIENFKKAYRILVFLVCILSVSAEASIPSLIWPEAKSGKPTLSCSQAYSMSRWAHSKFGGPKPPVLNSREFALRFSDALLEKWDPNKIFFTRNEVRNFKRAVVLSWPSFAVRGSCRAVGERIEQLLGTLNQRLEQVAPKVASRDLLPKVLEKNEVLSDTDLEEFSSFAANDAEVLGRVRTELKRIFKTLSQRGWEAFDQDSLLLVQNTLRDRFAPDEERTSAHWILLGSMGALDPYSTYLTDQEFEELTQDLSGVASGVGIRIRSIPEGIQIRQVLPDSPAGRSGELEVGDRIVDVNGKILAGLTVRKKQSALKGAEGSSSVTLGIRKADGSLKQVKLVREELTPEDAKVSSHLYALKQKDSYIAIIRVPSFYAESGWNLHGNNKSASADVELALKSILNSKKKIEAVVLDMRGNPGGFLEEAVSMAGLFMGESPVVSVVQSDQVKVLRNYNKQPLYRGPLVAVLDSDSASAAEVLAGALKDNGRAVIVTEGGSYGKGSVQRLFPVRDLLDGEIALPREERAGAMKLTTSLFFSPSGTSPEGAGIQAHIRLGEVRTGKKSHPLVHKLPRQLRELHAKHPAVTAAELELLEQHSRHRNRELRDSLSKSLSKILPQDKTVEVSPGLVEGVAVARDFALSPKN